MEEYDTNDTDQRSISPGKLSYLSPKQQFLVTLGIAFTLYLTVSLIAAGLLRLIYGADAPDIFTETEAFMELFGNQLNGYRFMQMFSSIGIFGLAAFLSSYLFTGSTIKMFEPEKRSAYGSMVYVPFIMLFAIPVVFLIHSYVAQLPVPESWTAMEESMEAFISAMLNDPRWSIFILNFIMIAIFPGIFEELLFRGVLQKQLTSTHLGPHTAILITSLLFGLIHGQVYNLLPIAALGLVLGYIYHWSGNIWFPILGHVFFNGIQAVGQFGIARGIINEDLDAVEMIPPGQTLIGLVFFVGFMYLFYTANQKSGNGLEKLG